MLESSKNGIDSSLPDNQQTNGTGLSYSVLIYNRIWLPCLLVLQTDIHSCKQGDAGHRISILQLVLLIQQVFAGYEKGYVFYQVIADLAAEKGIAVFNHLIGRCYLCIKIPDILQAGRKVKFTQMVISTQVELMFR